MCKTVAQIVSRLNANLTDDDNGSAMLQVYNGELAMDCLAQIDKSVERSSTSDDIGNKAGQQHSHALDGCYLHEVQASEALRLGCGLHPSEELPAHCLNAIAQLQDKKALGKWFAPFHESTPKFFGGDLGVCMAGHRDCVGIAQSCLQLRGYKLLLCDAGWSRSAVSDCSSRKDCSYFQLPTIRHLCLKRLLC